MAVLRTPSQSAVTSVTVSVTIQGISWVISLLSEVRWSERHWAMFLRFSDVCYRLYCIVLCSVLSTCIKVTSGRVVADVWVVSALEVLTTTALYKFTYLLTVLDMNCYKMHCDYKDAFLAPHNMKDSITGGICTIKLYSKCRPFDDSRQIIHRLGHWVRFLGHPIGASGSLCALSEICNTKKPCRRVSSKKCEFRIKFSIK